MIGARGRHPPDTAKTEAICAAYRARLAAGENQRDIVRGLAAEYDVQRPAIWKQLRAGGVIPAYGPKREGQRGRPIGGGVPGFTAKRVAASLSHSTHRAEHISTIPARLEACVRCGVRADVGCKHQRAEGLA